MAKRKLKKPPQWFYPLYKKSDLDLFRLLLDLGKGKINPEIVGNQREVSDFVKLLVVTQKMRNYRLFRDMVIAELVKKNILYLATLNKRGKALEIPKGIDQSWAIFTQDKELCLLIDKLAKKKIEYVGKKDDLIMFIARFLLSQLLQDWRGPKMMVVIESLKTKKVRLKKLNRLLKYWDFTKEFKS